MDGGRGGYSVLVGPGLLARLPRDLVRGIPGVPGPQGRPRRPFVAVVSDTRVGARYGVSLVRSLVRAGLRAALLTFPAGELSKTRETKSRLEDRLAALGVGRDGLIVALGGGVVGDLAGFLAATWLRGLPVIQAPTSLIAMLDASIGGKVGVNHLRAKNMIGAFHPPLAVYADTLTLDSLPLREFRSGLAEAVKTGAIAEGRLFRTLETDRLDIVGRNPRTVARLVLETAAVKARIVSQDAKESGRRQLLNFGHTIGHAVESAGGYKLRHGEAVAIGMVLESRIAVRMTILGDGDRERIERLLAGLGLPTRLPAGLDLRRVEAAVRRDKKVRNNTLQFALPARIGKHAGGDRYVVPVPEELVRWALRRG